MTRKRFSRGSGAILACVIFVLAACGGENPLGNAPGASVEGSETTASESTGGAAQEETAEEAHTPAEAGIGPRENSNMVPAGGKKPDPAQPPPENPPQGVKTFPATTNRIVNGDVEYTRTPPANGDHAPLWQNCGFYEKPVRDENAVHSLDHTGRSGSPTAQSCQKSNSPYYAGSPGKGTCW
jgi:hypothetical protein